MLLFTSLFQSLDSTTSTNAKVKAMTDYFRAAPPHDAAWALHLLMGGKLKRLVRSSDLHLWLRERTGLSQPLFEECYAAVGDLAETISLLVSRHERSDSTDPLHVWIEHHLLPLATAEVEQKRHDITTWWDTLGRAEIFVLMKFITGSLRMGVSRTLVERALADLSGLPKPTISHRLMGTWKPTAESYLALLRPELPSDVANSASAPDIARPYPFYLASPLELSSPFSPSPTPATQLERTLGPRSDWIAEWKWDGIRAQLIRRNGETFLWSRGDENITDRFPEILSAAARLPEGTVLDGEVLSWRDGRPLPFALLQRRIGRTNVTSRALTEAPAVFMTYDLLEAAGHDLRARPLEERAATLDMLLLNLSPRLLRSEPLQAPDWPSLAALRATSRDRLVEGLMLKRRSSPYLAGRVRGEWWKWKIDPLSLDMVLVYAQPGHGKRAGLLTDYTFAVRDADRLVPIAKAYSGLDNAEITALDTWLRNHTTERFGPVRAVQALQVFEIAFEGIAPSPRHASGIALRFPRIARWRKDKRPDEADTLDAAKALLRQSDQRVTGADPAGAASRL